MLRTLEEWRIYASECITSEEAALCYYNMVFDILKDWKESDLKWKVDLLEAKIEFLESLIRDLLDKEDHICEYMENGHCKICGESYNGH